MNCRRGSVSAVLLCAALLAELVGQGVEIIEDASMHSSATLPRRRGW